MENDETVHVASADVKKLPPELRYLYEDFCVLDGDQYNCPTNFNKLTPSWYVNHSDVPNARCDGNLRFWALRRIEKGEEITADYRTYGEDPLPWQRRRGRDHTTA